MAKDLRVLIVEDTESDAAVVVRQLSKAGYVVRERRVQTGEEMRAALGEGPWDVVIAEYRLSEFDAPAALAVLQETGRDTPFIVVSGTVGESTAVAMMEAGASDYLTKDNLTRLAPAVERALRDTEARRDRRRVDAADTRLLDSVRAINELAIELGGIQSAQRVRVVMAEKLRSLAGAVAVGVTSYDRAARELVVEYVAFPPQPAGLRERALAALGGRLIGFRSPVSPEAEQQILSTGVALFYSFHETTFGAMPKAVAGAVETALQSGDLYAMGFVEDGQLLGRCVIAVPRGAEAIPDQVQSTLARVCAVALRRALAEEALRASEARFSTVFHASPAPAALTRLADSTLVDVNEAWVTTTGYTRAEALGLAATAAIAWADPHDRDRLAENVRAAMKANSTKVARGLELALRTKDGPARHVLMSAEIVDAAGGPCLLMMAVDITDRKRAEAELRKATADLEKAHAMAHLGSWEWRVQEERLTWSSEVYRIFGFPRETALTTDGIVAAIHQEDRARNQEFVDRLLAGENAAELDFRVVRPGGDVRHVHLRAEVYRDGAGAPLIIFGTMQDVTEMKEIEAALRRSEKEYRDLIENLNDVVFTIDLGGRITFVSPSVQSVLGYPAAGVVERAYEEFIHPDDVSALRPSFEQTLAGNLRPSEFRFRTASGEYRWVRTSSRPKLDAGRVVGLTGILTDITERRRAEEAARASEAQLSAALRLAHLGHWEYDVERDLFTFNDHFYALLRTTAEREGGYTMPSRRYAERFIPREEATLVAVETRKALEATDPNYTSQVEHRVLFGDGSVGYLAVRIFIVKDGQGRTIRTYGVNQDITERRQSEEALRVSEERLRGVFQATVDGILVADAGSGTFVMANQTMCDMLGYSEDELLRLGVRDIHPPDALPAVMAAFRQQVAGIDSLSPAVPVKRRDGTTFIADINAVPLVMGGRSCLLGVFRDMTAIKELEAQMRQAQKMEAVGRLAGGVAHDFNNILGVVLGHCELAQKGLRPDDPLRRNLEQIQTGAERAAALTRQLLVFSRKQKLAPAVLDLNAVIHNLWNMLHRLLGEDVELELQLGERVGPILADPGQVEQVVINLAVNARDAMPGGGRLVIATGEAGPGSPGLEVDGVEKPAVVLTVTDTGSGMDEIAKQHLFEPFFTTKEVGKGTGLGLSTVYGIVQQAGGRIDFESELGRGTSFRVILPRAEGAPAARAVAEGRSVRAGDGETILVVEDEAGLREIVQDILGELGYKPVVAANGGEALLAVEEQHLRPDVLITDVVMPGMSGTTLADRLRKTLPDLKVLLMSGYTDVESRTDGGQEAGQTLLHKPFRADELAEAIREALGGTSDPASSLGRRT